MYMSGVDAHSRAAVTAHSMRLMPCLEDCVCVVCADDGQHLQVFTSLRPQSLQAHSTWSLHPNTHRACHQQSWLHHRTAAQQLDLLLETHAFGGRVRSDHSNVACVVLPTCRVYMAEPSACRLMT
jgi:hypothetical protein